MESIKHKMDLMIQEKNAAVEKAIGFETETAGLEASAKKFEKEVDEIQRKIAKVEDELDITISKIGNSPCQMIFRLDILLFSLKSRNMAL